MSHLRRFLFVVPAAGFAAAALVACTHTPAKNPDPNHTHADFAVWINGERLDFSGEEFMSGVSTDPHSHPTDGPRKYLHLHDGNGDVAHRHKPGLAFGEFLVLLGVGIRSVADGSGQCVVIGDQQYCDVEGKSWLFLVNGERYRPQDGTQLQDLAYARQYVFADTDKLLLSYGSDEARIGGEWAFITDDACLYSRTCPWKGDPPTENCIADPEVPCVIPEE